MKILFFGTYFYPYISGITIYPLRILSYLAKKNSVTALAFNHKKNEHHGENISGIKVIRMPFHVKISKGFLSFHSIKYFLDQVKKNDLIFVNFPNAEGLLLLIFAKIFKKKSVGIFHCRVFLTGGIFSKIINFLLNAVVFFQMALVDKIIIYTTDYFQSLTYEKLFVNKTLESFPPIKKYSPDLEKLEKLKKMKKNEIWIGFSGRTAREKGIEVLIEAIQKIRSFVKKDIRLVFVGPTGKDVVGESEYFDLIFKKLADHNINHIFLGTLMSQELWSFYSVIDFLVLPSINQTEAFGMVQAEAMLAGKPVVASNLPGVRVPVMTTKMGLLADPSSVESLAKSILEMINNYKKYANKDTHARAIKNFEEQKVYRFFDSLLKKYP